MAHGVRVQGPRQGGRGPTELVDFDPERQQKKRDMKLELQKFCPGSMKPYRIILLVGRRGTGKSVLTEDLMEHIAQKIDVGVAMTPTEGNARISSSSPSNPRSPSSPNRPNRPNRPSRPNRPRNRNGHGITEKRD